MSGWKWSGWLPDLEVVKWPRYERAQERHRALVASFREAIAAREELRARYQAEDENQREVIKQSVISGEPEHTVDLTPALRREAELEVAGEDVSEALSQLCDFVERTAPELASCQAEGQAAYDEIAAEFSVPPLTKHPTHISDEEQNRRVDDWRRSQFKALHSDRQRREALRRDLSTLTVLYTRTLDAGAFEVLQQIQRTRGQGVAA